MSQNKAPTHYRLTPKAQQDLEDHWFYGAQTWSIEQADKYSDIVQQAFEHLLITPKIERERTEFDPPVRIHTVEKHLVIYRIQDDYLLILRILGGRQDWRSILSVIDQ